MTAPNNPFLQHEGNNATPSPAPFTGHNPQGPYTGTPANPPYMDYGQSQGTPAAPYGMQAEPQIVQEEAVAAAQTGEYPLNLPYPGCPFVTAITRYFQNYAVFTGRASRSEFWWSLLFLSLVNLGISAIASIGGPFALIGGILAPVFALATIIPSIAILTRRAHDANYSGWWVIGYYLLTILGSGLIITGFMNVLGNVMFMSSYNTVSTVTSMISNGTTIAFMTGGMIVYLAAFVLYLVLTLTGSKPDGVRFDKQPTDVPTDPVFDSLDQ